MHIVIDARILTTTTGRYAERLIHYLEELDHQNKYSILLDQKGWNYWHGHKHSANFAPVLADFSMYGSDGQFGLYWVLRGLKPDLVHYTFQQTCLLYQGAYTMMLHDLTQLRFKNLKAGVNEKIYDAKMKILEKGFRHSAKKAKLILTGAEYIKKDIAGTLAIDPNKIIVTKEAGEVAKNRKPKAVKQLSGKEYILYVGNAHAHKNIDRLLDAFKIVQKSSPDLHLAIAGRVDEFHQKIIERIKTEKIENAHHLGFVEDEELVWLYKNAEAYIFPSLSEGFGLPGLEAMAYGCPVISSNATCLPEIYGEAAYYFDPYSPDDIAKKIVDVINDKALRDKLIKAGSDQIKKYSWKKCAQETLDVFNKINQDVAKSL